MLERPWVICPHGWAFVELGQVEEGISQIRAGLDTQLSEAFEDGLAVSNRKGNRYYDAELWRLKGELLKMQDKRAEAESCFQRAIEIAR